MESGVQGDAINPWGVRLFRTFKTIRASDVERGCGLRKVDRPDVGPRGGRGSSGSTEPPGSIPTPLWLVLALISAVVFVFMLFFADSGEGAATQAVLMGSVAVVVVSMLLLIAFLNRPFQNGVGGVRPVAMERTLRIVDQALLAVGGHVQLPCDARGNPVS